MQCSIRPVTTSPSTPSPPRKTGALFFENLPIRRNADAVIIPSFDIDPDEASRLQSANLPLVGINALPESAFTLSVSIDDEQAMDSLRGTLNFYTLESQ